MDPSMLGKCSPRSRPTPTSTSSWPTRSFMEPNGMALAKELIRDLPIHEQGHRDHDPRPPECPGMEVECARAAHAGGNPGSHGRPGGGDGRGEAGLVSGEGGPGGGNATRARRWQPDIARRGRDRRWLRAGEACRSIRASSILQHYGIPITREALATSADMAVGARARAGLPRGAQGAIPGDRAQDGGGRNPLEPRLGRRRSLRLRRDPRQRRALRAARGSSRACWSRRCSRAAWR